MFPLYEDGDILFVKKAETLKNNEIGIFFHNNETICKRYNLKDDIVILISENKEYEPRKVLPEELVIRGKVLGKYHVD